MDPLLLLRKSFKNNIPVSLHDNDGTPVNEISQCVFIKMGPYIYARDVATNFRSKRGAGDFYPLDAVWFMYEQKERTYGEYMQDARKNGLTVVSLVDKKDLVSYLEEDRKPEECQFVDTSAPLPAPRKAFTGDEVFKADEEEGDKGSSEAFRKTDSSIGSLSDSKRIKTIPIRSRDVCLISSKDFSNVLEIAKETLKSLETLQTFSTTSKSASTSTSTSTAAPVSLIEQIASANKPSQKPTDPKSKKRPLELPIPIIIVPAAPTALLTMYNAKEFLCRGHFIPTAKMKSQNVPKTANITIEHKFGTVSKKFQIIDDPTKLPPSDWSRIVAVFVQGNTWQFKGWKWDKPLDLFQHVKGYSINFDDTKLDQNLLQWNIHRLSINKLQRHSDATAIFQFWSSIEEYLKRRQFI